MKKIPWTIRRALIPVAYALIICAEALAGPWAATARQGYFKLGYQYQYSDEQFDSLGRRAPYESGGINEAHFLIAELVGGIGRGWQVTATLPIAIDVAFRESDRTARATGIGELWLFAARQLNPGAWVNALEAGVKVPLQAGIGADDRNKVHLTQGQPDALLRWHTGLSLWPTPGYIQAELGYLLRGANRDPGVEFQPGHEVWYKLDGGYRPWPDALIGLSLEGITGRNGSSTTTGDTLERSARKVTRLSPYAFLDLGGGLRAELRYYRLLAGQNFPAGDTWAVSAYWYF